MIHAQSNNSCIDYFNSSGNTSSVHGNFPIKESVEDDGNTILIVCTNAAGGDNSTSHVRITNRNNGNNISVNVTEADSTNHNHEMCISQDEKTKNDAVAFTPNSLPKRKSNISLANQGVTKHNALCCKFSIAFAMFFTIGCFLMPIIIYKVSQTNTNTEIQEDPEYSINKTTSSEKVCVVSYS